MDDYTWKKTIRRRRIKRRRQALLFLIILIIAAAAGLIWHNYTQERSPKYALEQAAAAVNKKDADTFRRYVNLDLVTSRAYDDLTADLFNYDATLTATSKSAYEKFYITIKPQLTSGTQDTILSRVTSGEWKLPDGTDILKGRQLGIDYERFLERSQMRNTSFVSIGKITRDGTTATAEINIKDDWTQAPFTLEVAMEQANDGHWQVTYIKNYRAYLDAITPLHNEDIAKYIDATKGIVASYNQKLAAYKLRFDSLSKSSSGSFTAEQKNSLKALIEQEVVPTLQARQQELDAVEVPAGARYLADQRKQATDLTLEAWQHFLKGLATDDPDEFAQAETCNKQELAVDLRVDDIIRHTAVSRNIPNLP
ncbi:hypothetical protein [Mitsuokella sp.]|uniref:hypothetical protein n=1 Tax=unclassified Mitsuokella TaxID=2637239 RepID=UPI003D7EA853